MTLELLSSQGLPVETLELLPGLEPERPEQLWYRDNDTGRRGYEDLQSYREAEQVIRTRTDRSPWATIARDVGDDNDPDWWRFVIEVLGTEDRMYVCGCVEVPGSTWFWSSWPRPMRRERTAAAVGPNWYQAPVWAEQLQTANDAVAQLRTALTATRFVSDQVPGYLWLPRRNDRSLLGHLRVPFPEAEAQRGD
jgi:hypothetical protein